MKIFTENSGFSWRKVGTALIYVLFSFLVIGNAIKTGFAETPVAYMAVIYMVITFYFAKEPIKNIGTKLKSGGVQPPNPNDPTPR